MCGWERHTIMLAFAHASSIRTAAWKKRYRLQKHPHWLPILVSS
jgi:hypothetical protein